MPDLPVSVRDFASILANGDSQLTVSKRRFLKFAVSTGAPVYSGTAGGRLSLAFASYKALAAKSSIDFTKAQFELVTGYRNLDPTEKANLSYWNGMTVAALLADHYLDVPHLLHVSAYSHLVGRDPASRALADLLGRDTSGRWHVLEAKARESVRAEGRAAWKRQAHSIKTVNGLPPRSSSYSLTRIRQRLRAELVDPPHDPRRGDDLSISEAKFFETYYRPIRRWLRDGTSITRGGEAITVRLVAHDALDSESIWVGLTSDRLDAESDWPAVETALEFEDAYVGRDGIVIATSPEGSIPT